MKTYNKILAPCFGHTNVWGTTAFSAIMPTKRASLSHLVLKSYSSETTSDFQMFPSNPRMDRIEGGSTVRTYQMPLYGERAVMVFSTNGRPMKAHVALWLGPERTTHFMDIDVEDGSITPYRAILKFKKGPLVVRVETKSSLELPILSFVEAPSPERSAELAANTERVWETSPKTRIQGGSTAGGGGAVRTIPIDANVDAIQVVFWSTDTGKKSLKCSIELLQGPNNKKQVYELQCGGGSQPYHAVFETPGPGWILRVVNKKTISDGLFEFAVSPYTGLRNAAAAPSQKQWYE
jgi:hypothetical protein